MQTEQRAAGKITALGDTPAVRGKSVLVSRRGGVSATVVLEARSTMTADENGNWFVDSDVSADGMTVGESNVEMEWRLNCTAYTSGTMDYKLEAAKYSSVTR